MKGQEEHYSDKPSLETPVDAPSYEALLSWIGSMDLPQVSFDFWARGNYLRHALHQRSQDERPILVLVKDLEELRWAYKRLLLTGLSVEFLWAGHVSKPAKVAHLVPSDIPVDAGWGYIGTLHSRAIAKLDGRECFPAIGWARLLPREVADWIYDEGHYLFLRGKLMVTPAPLVGIRSAMVRRGAPALALVTQGATLSSDERVASFLFDIQLPRIEGLSVRDLTALVEEHHDELEPFRRSLKKLISDAYVDSDSMSDAVEDVRQALQDVTRASKTRGLRKSLTSLGGVIQFASLYFVTQEPLMSALFGASGQVLIELVKEAKDAGSAPRLSLLWELGRDDVGAIDIRPRSPIVAQSEIVTGARGRVEPYHWLCPPTPGLHYLAVRK